MPINRPIKLLIISHDAELAGAEVLLLNLLKLLKNNNNYQVTLVLKRGGILEKEFSALYPFILLKPSGYGTTRNISEWIRERIRSKIKLLHVCYITFFSDFIFSNTIVNGRLLKILSSFNKNCIVYVHELKQVIDEYWAIGESRFSLRYSKKILYPSLQVRNTLLTDFSVNKKKLFPLNYYFPLPTASVHDPQESRYVHLLKDKIPNLKRERIIGGMGAVNKRKGVDLFIEACAIVAHQIPDILFCWIGEFVDASFKKELENRIMELGIQKNILFTGPLPHNYNNFSLFDIFFLSSREDPYPLVVLEAAWKEKPTICFQQSGGIVEFIENDAGWQIPDFSVSKASKCIIRLLENLEEVKTKGKAAHKKFMEKHHSEQLIFQQLDAIINDTPPL